MASVAATTDSAFYTPSYGAFRKCFGGAGMLEYNAACATLVEFEIWTPERVAAAWAQWHHESAGLKRLEESFDYTPERLVAVFANRVGDLAHARQLVSKGPEAIANFVYGGRMGNSMPGDGWRFRGRGPTQLTFRANYAAAARGLNLPLAERPQLVAMIEVGFRVAGFYWFGRGCNQLADADDFEGLTRRLNGGLNGLSDRMAQWKRIRSHLGLPN